MMLLWGLAAAAPILIHLWNRRRHRETDWAAMKFLLAAMKKHRRRIQVEQLLLLLVRCAILLFFAIALADISCVGGGGLARFGRPGTATHTVLVIDHSYSMAYGEEGQTRLDQAKQLARRMVEDAGEGDGFTLIALGRTAQGIIAEPAFDPTDVLREIDQLKIEPGVAMLDLTLAEVESTLRIAARDFPRLQRAQVCIFSDMGSVTWQAATAQSSEQVTEQIAQLASIRVIDVGEPQTTNSAILSATQLTPYLTPEQTARFRIDLSCDNPAELTGQVVQMVIDGKLIAQQSVQFAENESVSVEMSTTFREPGTHGIEFRLQDDLLETDNRRYLVVEVKPELRVLALADDPSSLKFLRLALDPSDGQPASLRTTTLNSSALLDVDLLSYDVMYLSNVAQIGMEEASVLRSFAEQGGGIVFFLGDRVSAASYNSALGGTAEGSTAEQTPRLLPVTLDSPTPRGEFFLDPRQYEHPLVEPFRGQQAGGLLSTPVWNYYKAELAEEVGAQTALWFDSGDPAIVTSRYRIPQDGTAEGDLTGMRLGGSIVVFCLPASTDSVDRSVEPPAAWTVFPTWPSFPPLVQESLAHAVASQIDRRNRELGTVYAGVIEGNVGANLIEVTLPDDQKNRIEAKARDARLYWSFDDTSQVGIYHSQPLGGGGVEKVEFAINPDARESDLSRIALDTLPESLRPGDHGFDAPGGTQLAAVPTMTELFRYALILVMGLLFLESFLAYRFGAATR